METSARRLLPPIAAAATRQASTTLHITAAISLQEVLEEILNDFAGVERLVPSALCRFRCDQRGWPSTCWPVRAVDLFVGAEPREIDRLGGRRAIRQGTRRLLARTAYARSGHPTSVGALAACRPTCSTKAFGAWPWPSRPRRWAAIPRPIYVHAACGKSSRCGRFEVDNSRLSSRRSNRDRPTSGSLTPATCRVWAIVDCCSGPRPANPR